MEKEILENDLFYKNEQDANKYATNCLIGTVVVVFGSWFLNVIGVFAANQAAMNCAMVLGILILLPPIIIVKKLKKEGTWVKYMLVYSLVVGIGVLYSTLTHHIILAWACPIVVSSHYYSPKLTKQTTLAVIFTMFISIFVGLLVGEWDYTLMRSTANVYGISERLAIIAESKASGYNTFLCVFTYFFIPRCATAGIIYLICQSLSDRTHNLLVDHAISNQEQARVKTELSMATDIQHSSLPNIFPAFPANSEFDIFATMIPSKEVGGDFYDFYFINDDKIALLIADVSGKGVPAALYMMVSKTIIKNIATLGNSPAKILEIANNQLCENEDSEMFVTAWLGIYQISTGKLTYANAGHEKMLLKRNGEDFQFENDRHGFVLGGMSDLKYKNYTCKLDVGDSIFVYTDGVLEAINKVEEDYGKDRLLNVLNNSENENLEKLLTEIKDDIDNFADGAEQFDDITMLTLKRLA